MGWLAVSLFSCLLGAAWSLPLDQETGPAMDAKDMEHLLTSLFIPHARDGREIDLELENIVEEEEEVLAAEDTAAAAVTEEKEESDGQEIDRFNNYIDAIYKRMNAALRAKLMDPMVLNLAQKIKKGTEEVNQRVEREAEEEEEEKDGEADATAEQEIEHRVGSAQKRNGNKRKGNKKKNKTKDDENQEKRGKNKNNKREKSDKKIEKGKKDKTQQREEKEAKKAENKLKRQREKEKAKKEKAAARKEKKAAKKQKEEDRAAKKAEREEEKRKEQIRESRQHGAKNKKKRDQRKRNNGKNEKDEKKVKKSRRSKKNKKGKGSKARKNDRDEEAKMMGSLAGIATLRRFGDVTVEDEENHKIVSSAFTVGPLQLEVSKTLGHGKSRTVKTAKAITDVMSGTMQLKVKADGSAHVKKVVFKKPERVDVKGSLSDNEPRSINVLKNSVNKMRPIAAQKILKTARYVLKAPTATSN